MGKRVAWTTLLPRMPEIGKMGAQGWKGRTGMLEVYKIGAAPSGGCIVVNRLSPKEAPSSQQR